MYGFQIWILLNVINVRSRVLWVAIVLVLWLQAACRWICQPEAAYQQQVVTRCYVLYLNLLLSLHVYKPAHYFADVNNAMSARLIAVISSGVWRLLSKWGRSLSVQVTFGTYNFLVQTTSVHWNDWMSVLVHVKFSTSQINFGSFHYWYKITFGTIVPKVILSGYLAFVTTL